MRKLDKEFEAQGWIRFLTPKRPDTIVQDLLILNAGQPVFVPYEPPPGRFAIYVEDESEDIRIGLWTGRDTRCLLARPRRVWFCALADRFHTLFE